MSSAQIKASRAIETAREFFAAYNAHDVNGMLELCRDDARLRYVPMGSQGEGRARETGKAIWSGLIDAFPDLSVTVHSMFGDTRHVAAEVTIGGTQRKDFLSIPSQGKRYDLPHAFLLRMDDDYLVSDITAYWDNARFCLQLGKKTLD